MDGERAVGQEPCLGRDGDSRGSAGAGVHGRSNGKGNYGFGFGRRTDS